MFEAVVNSVQALEDTIQPVLSLSVDIEVGRDDVLLGFDGPVNGFTVPDNGQWAESQLLDSSLNNNLVTSVKNARMLIMISYARLSTVRKNHLPERVKTFSRKYLKLWEANSRCTGVEDRHQTKSRSKEAKQSLLIKFYEGEQSLLEPGDI
jgi:hypothetical protein